MQKRRNKIKFQQNKKTGFAARIKIYYKKMDNILPENIEEKDLLLFNHKLEREIPPHEIKEINDVFFNSGNLIFRGGKILPISFVNGTLDYYFKNPHNFFSVVKNYWGLKKFLADPFLLASRFFKKKIVISEPCLCFTDTWSLGYFHWFLDALPRLLTAEKYLAETMVILPAKFKNRDYIISGLKIFKVKNIRWVEKNEVLAIKKLIIPAHIAPSGNYDPKIIRALIEKIKNYCANKRQLSLGDKIFISREKAERRKISNEKEILPILSKYGFKKIILEDYSWEDQLGICQNANHLIGNHGAGLTNLIFMGAGGKILELGGEQNQFYHYFSLAKAADIKYFYQVCAYSSSLFKRTNNKKDIIVDLEKLERNIKLMLDAK
jgi:hypothetical protein